MRQLHQIMLDKLYQISYLKLEEIDVSGGEVRKGQFLYFSMR